jgi:8-oxo-dGTP pyrophosphatase MutT (NUDIX family)
MHYVVGFQFNNDGDRVALIRKGRPEWQAGLWNGIGGGVERGESVKAAMEREFEEEAGLSQRSVIWRPFADLRTWTHNLITFCSSFTDSVDLVCSATDEEVSVYSLARLYAIKTMLVPNVLWLIEMALTMRTERVGADGRESASHMVITETPPHGLSR